MNSIRKFIPNFASDTAGACSALFGMGGLTVIHDAAGCMESYSAYDEPRMFGSDSLVFSSSLKNTEAVTGDETKLVKKLTQAAKKTAPPFMAIVGSPVPYTIGTDLEGIAAEAEAESGVPTFAVGSGGFRGYDYGASEAMLKYYKKLGLAEKPDGYTVNLLGATPMDLGKKELEEIINTLEKNGIKNIRVPFMGDMLCKADLNIVVSIAGLALAKQIKLKHATPYITGIPIGQKLTRQILNASADCTQDNTFKSGEVLVMGEAVYAASMARAIYLETGLSAAAGVTGMTDRQVLDGVKHEILTDEDSILNELRKDYTAIIGDPIYLSAAKGKVLIKRPHAALSSHLFNEPNGFEDIINQLKEIHQ